MTKPTPISCSLYDYLEVACLYRYDLTITLRDGSILKGQAVTTRVGSDKVEYLCMTIAGEPAEVPMHELATVETCNEGASFKRVEFAKLDH